MASAVADLEVGLQAMLGLKPPGVSGSRITSLTKLCVDNVQSESVLIQKMFTHFKKAPVTHKLGVLYVVDSVTRKWLEQAKASGQPVDSSAPDGTYAAGVHRVTELMPVLMNDILQSAPEGQKDKISKLLDIWEKGQTFSPAMIESFRQKLKAAPEPSTSSYGPISAYFALSLESQVEYRFTNDHPTAVQSTTPEGSPPPGLVAFMGYNTNKPAAPTAPTPPTAQNSNAIMEALANLARQNNAAAPAKPPAPAQNPAQSNAFSVLSNLQSVASQHQQAAHPINHSQPAYSMPPISQPAVTAAPAPFSYAPPQPPAQPQAMPASMTYPGAAPPQPPAASVFDAQAQQQLLLIKTLADQGIPLDKIPALLAALGGSQPGAIPAAPAAPATSVASNYYATGQGWGGPVQTNDGHDQHRYSNGPKSPSRYSRSRSRSPGRRWNSHGNRDDYGHQSSSRGHQDGRDSHGRGNDYRQRSPVGRNGRSPTPRHNSGEKWVDYDRSLPQGKIKVLSRTLFVGGVTYTERELRDVFSKYGQVQTCIVNKEKRHAFVKMVSRHDAVRAKEAMEASRDGDPQLRTRWGVGFGPRDCSDYQTGVSIIPIAKLTEADRKWMLTAEYGGSGGRPIETGLVVEEPDIEIGAGVSSKAISRRMQTDKSGHHGPRSTRSGRHESSQEDNNDDSRDDYGRQRRGRDRRDDKLAPGVSAQSLPQQFPFGIGSLPNGMPVYPPGFMFPAPGTK
nr:RNA-binding protein [Colletotrichum truncatum]KAF6793515.1 RNA-binding protein [Colletotrichum truncatum]